LKLVDRVYDGHGSGPTPHTEGLGTKYESELFIGHYEAKSLARCSRPLSSSTTKTTRRLEDNDPNGGEIAVVALYAPNGSLRERPASSTYSIVPNHPH
jgi:hypothetical protein